MLELNLKRVRECRSLTQRQLAERVNYSQQAIAKWEAGLSSPDATNLVRLSHVLHVTIGCLLYEQPESLHDFSVWGLHVALFHVLNQCNTYELLGYETKHLSEREKIEFTKKIVAMLREHAQTKE